MKYNKKYDYLDIPVYGLDSDYLGVLKQHGIVKLQVPENFTSSEFKQLAAKIANPLPESDKEIGSYIEDGVILNLVTKFEEGADMKLQPFSADGLTMHIERAFSTLDQQPNYLCLLCIVPPDESVGGQTIVASMKDIEKVFTENEIETMKLLYPKTIDGSIVSVNSLVKYDPERGISYISYRDLGDYGKDWEFVESQVNEEIKAKIAEKLKAALYNDESIKALKWDKNILYIFDNKRYFHSRTEQEGVTARHLKRIRMV